MSAPADVPSGFQVPDVVLQSAGTSPGTALCWLFLPGGFHLAWRKNLRIVLKAECEPSTGTITYSSRSCNLRTDVRPERII